MFKRKYSQKSYKSSSRAPYKKRRTSSKKYAKSRSKLVKLIRRVSLKTQETKKSVYVNSARATIAQSQLYFLDATPLSTSQGTGDPNTSRTGNRIGDEVTPVGLSVKFAVALDPRQSYVRFRWMLIRSAFADVPSISNLFIGAVDNKQIDPVDTGRFTILSQKYFKIARPNAAIGGTDYTTTTVTQSGNPTGTEQTAGAQDQQWAPYIFKRWIPGKAFGRKLKYQSDTSQSPKNWSYYSLLIAYGSDVATDAATLTPGTSLARMDQYLQTFYFKDA